MQTLKKNNEDRYLRKSSEEQLFTAVIRHFCKLTISIEQDKIVAYHV